MPALSKSQLDAIADVADAVVQHDPTRLATILGGADALYGWSKGGWQGAAELSTPPGPPAEWALDTTVVSSSPRQVQ